MRWIKISQPRKKQKRKTGGLLKWQEKKSFNWEKNRRRKPVVEGTSSKYPLGEINRELWSVNTPFFFYMIRWGTLSFTKVSKKNLRVCRLDISKSVSRMIPIQQTIGVYDNNLPGILDFLQNPASGRLFVVGGLTTCISSHIRSFDIKTVGLLMLNKNFHSNNRWFDQLLTHWVGDCLLWGSSLKDERNGTMLGKKVEKIRTNSFIHISKVCFSIYTMVVAVLFKICTNVSVVFVNIDSRLSISFKYLLRS